MTDFTTPRTWANGELVIQSMMNTHVRDNFLALFPYTAVGQIAVSDTTSHLTVLSAASNANKKLVSNGTTWILQNDTRYLGTYLNADVALVSGSYTSAIPIPPDLDSFNITQVVAWRKSGTGLLTIQLRNIRTGNNILSTALTVDSGETCSNTAATPAVINSSFKTVAAYDDIACDVTVAGTSTLFAKVMIGLTRY